MAVNGVVMGPTAPTPTAGLDPPAARPAPPVAGTIIVAYLKPGTTRDQVAEFFDTEDALGQAHQRAGQFGLIPVSLIPDYVDNLVRITMSATASAADIAAFKAELLRNSLIERVS